ncbi:MULTISPECIES: transposase [Lactiplantibacillus]|uniref:transposase n=1 Tax=Lactiplantibacillus TaxID=2767842 RepID=UPI0002B3F60E|nr:transposase [Lactiplantibacillus plantarum]AGE39230.1 Integrase [Lactiplantibacillus plantarum ZJ316]AGO07993.1 transposase [Lactiplantibacillus plantarum 16]ANI95008.1 integrase [Lactiplantibacillus plantarum]ANJ13389.1 integrase [Lactiplantibacillus plantarum]APB85210.1 transposase [Lactiplantibacillus plantarum]
MPRSRYSAVEKLALITEFQNANRCQVRQKKRSRIQQQEQYLQDNVLDQQFNASRPNQAWLADSTELVYGVNGQYKVRLSGVLDLYGRHLIAHRLSETETSNAEIQVFQ